MVSGLARNILVVVVWLETWLVVWLETYWWYHIG